MLNLNALIGFGAGGAGGPVVATQVDEDVIIATQAVFTHTLDIGAAFPGRFVVVSLSGYRPTSPYLATITGVTFNGVAASFIQNVQTFGTAGLAYAYVPSGTTLTVVVTFSTASIASSISRSYTLTNVTQGQVNTAASGPSNTISITNTHRGAGLIAEMTDSNFVTLLPATGNITPSTQLLGSSNMHRSISGHVSGAGLIAYSLTANTDCYANIVAAFR